MTVATATSIGADGIQQRARTTRFRRRRTIPFTDVARVRLGYLGRRSNLVAWYYLVLEVRSGGTCTLFAPGRFFPGASDRTEMVERKNRLERYLAPADTAR